MGCSMGVLARVLAVQFFFVSLLGAEGFGAGTLVKTPTGYVPIEQLKSGDQVATCADPGQVSLHATYGQFGRRGQTDQVWGIGLSTSVVSAVSSKVVRNLVFVAPALAEGLVFVACAIGACICAAKGRGTFTPRDSRDRAVSAVRFGQNGGSRCICGHECDTRCGCRCEQTGCSCGLKSCKSDGHIRSTPDLANQGAESQQNRVGNPHESTSGDGTGRVKNCMSKTEFFEGIKGDYAHWRKGVYKRKAGARGIEGAEYLAWDATHQDVEAYNRSGIHLGSVDPKTRKLYKPPIYKRKVDR